MHNNDDIPGDNFPLKDFPVLPGETTSAEQEVFKRLADRRRQASLDPETYPAIKADCQYDTTKIMMTAGLATRWTTSFIIPELRKLVEDSRKPSSSHKTCPETPHHEVILRKIDELATKFDSSFGSLRTYLQTGDQGEAPSHQTSLDSALIEIRSLHEESNPAPLLEELQKRLRDLYPILKFYAGLEGTRIFRSDATVIGNADHAVGTADAQALACQIAKDLKERTDCNAPWYDREIATIPIRAWCFIMTQLLIIIIILTK